VVSTSPFQPTFRSIHRIAVFIKQTVLVGRLSSAIVAVAEIPIKERDGKEVKVVKEQHCRGEARISCLA